MIKKEKYTYWLDSHNLNEEVIYREMYARIGHIFHIVQMVEYNIANVLAIERYIKIFNKPVTKEKYLRIKEKINQKFLEYKKLTFGGLNNLAKNSKFLEDVDFNTLEECKKYRDYLAHQCFKEKLMKNELNTIDDADAFVDELNKFEEKIAYINEEVLEVFKKCKSMEAVFKNEHK